MKVQGFRILLATEKSIRSEIATRRTNSVVRISAVCVQQGKKGLLFKKLLKEQKTTTKSGGEILKA